MSRKGRSQASEGPARAGGSAHTRRSARGADAPDAGVPPEVADPLALPFDQYQRYRLVADLLEHLRGVRGVPLEVLDVGGRTALLRRFLLRDRIRLVDMEASKEEDLVLGDGGHLPFRDASFDVVTAFDTLEHVPPERREAFVAECARVARRWVVLAGPFHSPRVAEAEELLERFLLEKLGVEHRYLGEHRSHGLPDRGAVEAQLAELGARVTRLGHGNLDRWLVLMCASMYMDDDPALRGLARAFHRFYNASLYASDHAEPVYRHVVLAAFDGAEVPAAEELLDAPQAPAGALPELGRLERELVAFDRERAEWRAERERLRRVARDLEEDLAGHRASLAEARAEAGELGAVHRDLEADLEGHRARLTAEEHEAARLRSVNRDLAEDLSGHRDSLRALKRELEQRAEGLRDLQLELERERRVGEESRRALAEDLAQHRSVLAERDEQLEALRAAAQAQRSELEARVEEHRGALAEREDELAALRAAREAEGEAHARDLAGHRASLDELRSVLREKDVGIDHLTGELRRLEGVAAELQGGLAAESERAGELERRLRAALEQGEALRAELAAREADLRDRWGNLKRALGRKRR